MPATSEWASRVRQVFNTRPRIGTKATLWVDRKEPAKKLDEAFRELGAHICLDGPSGVGKTSLALTYLEKQHIRYIPVQLTGSTDWSGFCRQIIPSLSNIETSTTGEIEVGVDKALPTFKLRIGAGDSTRPSDQADYLETLSRTWTEHDVARTLAELNCALLVDDVERANEPLVSRLSDICKLLIQSYTSDNARLLLTGSADIFRRITRHNPSLDERLLQVSLGALKASGTWWFLTRGFERLGLLHPGNSPLAHQRNRAARCAAAAWEAADGLPKSINLLGQKIALAAADKRAVPAGTILQHSANMAKQHWIQYAEEFPHVLHFLAGTPFAVELVASLYAQGVAAIHDRTSLFEATNARLRAQGVMASEAELETALTGLAHVGFLIRTGRAAEILFVRDPVAAHTLGVVMREPSRFPLPTQGTTFDQRVTGAFHRPDMPFDSDPE